MDKLAMYEAALAKAAQMLLGSDDQCDVPKALALLELAREARLGVRRPAEEQDGEKPPRKTGGVMRAMQDNLRVTR